MIAPKYFADLKTSGKENFKDALATKVATVFEGTPSKDNDKEAAILELIWLCIEDSFDCRDTATALHTIRMDVLKSDEHRIALVHTIENAIWFWATQIEYDYQQPSDQWKQLAKLTANLFNVKIIEENVGKCVLPTNLLIYALNMAEKEDDLKKKLLKIKTRLFFKQEKFNILREEVEGYAKLVTVLSDLPAPPSNPTNHVKTVFSAIGQFDLDPNRVIDIVLDNFEQQLWNLSFVSLLRIFPKKNLLHIL
jgi:THO complex subunit 2